MLGRADQALVDRDPTLPGLALLLDAETLEAWLSDRTGAPCRVRCHRIRYKKATSCSLGFDLDIADQRGTRRLTCLATTYSAPSAGKAARATRHTSDDSVVAEATDIPLLVTSLAGDRHVPALAKLEAPDTREQVLRRVLPDHPVPIAAMIRTLKYNPERRWVGTLDDGAGDRMVLRAYRRDDLPALVQSYEALASGSGLPRTPALLGFSRRHALAAVSWAVGRPLSGDPADLGGGAAAGRALAILHQRPSVQMSRQTPSGQQGAVHSAAAQIADLLPELSAEVADTASRISSRLTEPTPEPTVLHGDFSIDQVVLDEHGAVTLIDLDRACAGDPASDLGCAAAALAQVDDPRHRNGALLSALHDGYDSLRRLPSDRRLATHTAAHLLRRAAEPFRGRETDWDTRLRVMCARAGTERHPDTTSQEH